MGIRINAMRVMLAPDAFKGSMTQQEVAEALQTGMRHTYEGPITFDTCLMADGGEGTVEVLAGASSTVHEVEVVDAYGRPHRAYYRKMGHVAIAEAAQATPYCSPEQRPDSALHSTSFGTGQLLQACLANDDITEIWLGLGGTGSTDGGLGFLAGIGAQFTGVDGELLDPMAQNWSRITRAHVPSLKKKVVGLVDVTAPLTGPLGAIHQFGPQKGLTPEDCEWAENALSQFAQAIAPWAMDTPGSGAAGGMGYALLVAGGELYSGSQFTAEKTHLHDRLLAADVIVTGEGQLDSQSLDGKVVSVVLGEAVRCRKPAIVVAGALPNHLDDFYKRGMSFALSLIQRPLSTSLAMKESRQLAVAAGETLGRILNLRMLR